MASVADLATLAPAAGVAATLALVIGYLLRANAADRRDYQEAVDKAEARADAMSKRLADANVELDAALAARRQAEDDRARSKRELNDLQHRTREATP